MDEGGGTPLSGRAPARIRPEGDGGVRQDRRAGAARLFRHRLHARRGRQAIRVRGQCHHAGTSQRFEGGVSLQARLRAPHHRGLQADDRRAGCRRQVLNLGSSQSRKESPKRLKANTARLMARPGKKIIHGASLKKSVALPESMSPQAGVGSVTPSPRKESEASSRIAWAMKAVSMMM